MRLPMLSSVTFAVGRTI